MHRASSPVVRRSVAVHPCLVPRTVLDDLLAQLATSPWALAALFVLVVGDAFLVVVPGEAAVTAFGALAVSTGALPIGPVIAIAAAAAFTGDAACYLLGRAVGLDRWRWMRHPRVRALLSWAAVRLDRRTAAIVFTARFVPFARLAVNLTAGASRVAAPRYLVIVALAALGWAAYQALVGALIAWLLPGSTTLAVAVSIGVALTLGLAVDAVLARRTRREDGTMSDGSPAAGYDDGFLDVALRMPVPRGDGELAVLSYLRFSVILDTRRRLAAVTAVNIDGGSLQDVPRTGDWDLDPRVPAEQQTGAAVYAGNDLDRGHLVRRRDPGWGTAAEARAATEATFVYTNAAPQASVFNQSKDLWVGLEDHVLEYADATDQRVSVFTAPVLLNADPPYRGIRIPRRFWKVAAWTERSPDSAPVLAATGFVLDQTDLIEPATAVVARLGAFRTFQVPIADIAQLAGIDFGALVDADVLAQRGARPEAWIELADEADIRL
jgi:DNA/RNA endonuclease G (NUC1)/membrane protein DedA with SNARE-associated domain